MKYDFTDIDTVGTKAVKSENQLIYNGVNIDETLTDQTGTVITLNVSGRGLAEYRYSDVKPAGVDGSMFESIYLEPRILDVEMQISAVNSQEFRRLFERLNKVLRSSHEVPIKFTDDNDHTFHGVYVSASQPKDDSNEQVITVTFNCSDPMKETDEKQITASNSEVLELDSDYPVKPHIRVVFPDVTDEFSLHNTTQGKSILYKKVDGFKTQQYHLEVNNNRIYRSVNETDGYNGLLLSSDWEEFTIQTGDQITVQPEPQSINIYYKGVKL